MRAAFDSLMFRTVLWPLTACLRLFALYTLIHGHDSPGGGFQAGVLFGASFLLPRLITGAPHRPGAVGRAVAAGAAGVLVYASIAAASLVLSAPLLDYGVLPLPLAETAGRRALGILGIEIGVTIAVAGVVVAVFEVLTAEAETP